MILIWGAISLACFPLSKLLEPSDTSRAAEIIAADWILDARLVHFKTIVLVTAHNALHIYCRTTETFICRIDCDEQSLLYAAQICLSNAKAENKSSVEKDGIVIAAGTVFNEIQIWQPVNDLVTGRAPIQKRLIGHEGCIFSLRFNENGSLLASCSDDRTIRIWDVKEGTLLTIGFAHIARVWDVRFIPRTDTGDENIYLLSTSEDTSALLWRFAPATRKLKVQERYHGHEGKHVWSQAISSDGSMAVTGGNDGSVNIWDIGGWRTRTEKSEEAVHWSEKSPPVVVNGREQMDPIKGFHCIDDDRLLITTKSGYS
jgi:WD repeat-containing protein 6